MGNMIPGYLTLVGSGACNAWGGTRVGICRRGRWLGWDVAARARAWKNLDCALGAGGRWFESSRPDLGYSGGTILFCSSTELVNRRSS